MTSEKCRRCGFPIVSNPEKGCTEQTCACTCDRYPACGCGAYDKMGDSSLKIPVEPKITVQTPAPADANFPGSPIPPAAPETFVLMNRPSEGTADVVYIGSSKEKAFDRLLKYGKDNYCQVCDLQIVKETE